MPNKDMTLSQKTQIQGILLIKNHEASTTSLKGVVYINLSSKK